MIQSTLSFHAKSIVRISQAWRLSFINRVSKKIMTLNFGKESVLSSFGVRSGSIQGLFGFRSGQFRTQIFGAKNLKFQKFSICAAVAAVAGAPDAATAPNRQPPTRPRRRAPRRGGRKNCEKRTKKERKTNEKGPHEKTKKYCTIARQ